MHLQQKIINLWFDFTTSFCKNHIKRVKKLIYKQHIKYTPKDTKYSQHTHNDPMCEQYPPNGITYTQNESTTPYPHILHLRNPRTTTIRLTTPRTEDTNT